MPAPHRLKPELHARMRTVSPGGCNQVRRNGIGSTVAPRRAEFSSLERGLKPTPTIIKSLRDQCLAERGHDGSRGFQPTESHNRGTFVAARRLNLGGRTYSLELKRIFARPALWLFALLIFPVCLASARDEFPVGPKGGADLAQKLRSLRPQENSQWKGTLKISGRDRKTITIPVQCITAPDDTDAKWTVTYLTSAIGTNGIERLTVVHAADKPNEYFFSRSPAPGKPLDDPKKLSGAEADIPLADSDFWLSDLGFEFYHWPGQNILGTEKRHSRMCYALESTNPHPTLGGYTRVVTWVDQESGAPLQAEAYRKDSLLKEYVLGSAKKVNGRWELKNLEMINDQTRWRTHLEFDLSTP